MKPALAIIATAGIVGLAWAVADSTNPEPNPVVETVPTTLPATTTKSTDWLTDTESDDPEYVTPEPRTFMGYECTSDCSGHEAGYDWAYENDVCDTEFDGGNSQSFAEGVRAYSEENC